MKFAFPLLTGFAFVTPLHAAILSVDNNPGSVAQYKTFSAAYTAASDGDTILLAGSATSYGNHNLYKRLTIVGPGYLLAENEIPSVSTHPATINLTFKNDPVVQGTSTGSRISGLSGSVNSDNNTSGVVVERHNGSVYLFGQATVRSSRLTGCSLFAGGSMVQNSIMDIIQLDDGTQAQHCIIGDNSVSTEPLSSITNSIFTYTSSNPFGSLHAGTVSHCMALGGAWLPAGNGNLNGPFVFNNVFVNTGSPDARFRLKANSPAIGAGTGGVDMGIFGGAAPYKPAGIPNIPRLTRIVVPASATNTSGLRFEVNAQSSGD